MRRLHPVGFTTDLDGLIFSTRKGSKSGSYVVIIGEDLMDKLNEAQRLRNGAPAGAAPYPDRAQEERDRDRERESRGARGRPQSALTPREIQARLRAGRSIDEVAREAEVGQEWVERFAAPIIAEQAKVIELAQSLRSLKARLGESAMPLGDSVAVNLLDRGVRLMKEEFDEGWSTYQLHDRIWLVQFLYRSRGRPQQAAWQLDIGERTVTARDRLASDLGYVTPNRRKVAPHPLENGEEALPDPAPVEAAAPARRARPTAAKAAGRPAAAGGSAPRVAPPPRTTARATSGPKKASAKGPAKARKAARPTAKPAATAAKPAAKAAKRAAKPAAKPAKAARPAAKAKPAKTAARAAKAATAVKKGRPAAKAKATAKKAKAAPKPARPAAKTSRVATRNAPVATKAAAARSTVKSTAKSTAKKGTTGARKAPSPSPAATPPRFGTDGSRLANAAAPPARRPRPASVPTAAAPAPSPAPAPRRADTEERRPPRRFDTNPRPSTPRAAEIVERLSAMRQPPSQGAPSPFAPRDEPAAPPPRRAEPVREKPEDDAFVIRPRISAKQAAELASPGS